MKFFVLLSILALVHGQNYCDKKLCRKGKHIGCKNNGEWAKKCPRGVSLVNLGPYVNMILESHNDKRDEIASGALKPFPQATEMALMQWDTELAYLAELNVRKCQGMNHDTCFSTKTFQNPGQNLALMRYLGYDNSIDYMINNRIDAWWNEYKVATPAQLAKYPSRNAGPISHFTVMAAAKNVRVGCAASNYMEDTWEVFLFVCNYATTNIVNKPVYVAGRAASGCTGKTDKKYIFLCSS